MTVQKNRQGKADREESEREREREREKRERYVDKQLLDTKGDGDVCDLKKLQDKKNIKLLFFT